jgi:hypothetical protein
MENLIFPLLIAGVLAGLINFFVVYVDLPFTSTANLVSSEPTKLRDIWWIALIGYIVVGCGGAFLTLTVNAMVPLKGLEKTDPTSCLVLFGYGIMFGYSTTRILVSVSDMLLKKVTALEEKVKTLQAGK